MEFSTEKKAQSVDGLRQRKRRDTLQRIAKAGLDLFLTKGYEETTLDDISAAAEISRRTFFYYFKSKDEILLAWQSGLVEALRKALLEEPSKQSPLDTLCNALLNLAAPFNSDSTLVIAQLLKSNDHLRAANQAKYLQLEQTAFEVLCELWPHEQRSVQLRMIAMIGLGAFRVAVDDWTDQGGKLPFPEHLSQALKDLRTELQRT